MIERWRRRYDDVPIPVETREELDKHFAAIHDLIEDLGLRPFGKLDLSLPSNSFECQVVFRWRRDAPSHGTPERSQ